MPFHGDRSAGYVLDKHSAGSKGKEACKGKRIAHVLCPFWKAWRARVLARGQAPELPPSDHGFAGGRRREGAMLITVTTTFKFGRGAGGRDERLTVLQLGGAGCHATIDLEEGVR